MHRLFVLPSVLPWALCLAALLPLAAAGVPTSGDGPAVAITAAPPARTTDRFASFAFAAPGADRYECALDGAAWAPCTSPWTVWQQDPGASAPAALPPGTHGLRMRALRDGHAGAPAGADWQVVSLLAAALDGDVPDGNLRAEAATPPPYVGMGPGGQGLLQGIARFRCLESHTAYDDPVLLPGRPGAAHLHSFWGNTAADAASTGMSLFTTGGSTCQGGPLNRSAYWVPALLAPMHDAAGHRTGWQPVLKDADPRAVAHGRFHETYYYAAVVSDVASIVAPPPDLRMIAGDARGTADAPADHAALGDPDYIAHWYCARRASKPGRLPHYEGGIPTCPLSHDAAGRPDELVHFVVRFPSCWDGVHLDSADHRSHMAYPVFATDAQGRTDSSRVVCPADHPVPIPEVGYHYSFAVTEANADPATHTSRGWRLASDTYAVGLEAATAGGRSLHGDWINAWHPEVLQAFVDGCLKQRKDCHDGQLGTPQPGGPAYRLGDARREAWPAYPALPDTELAGMPHAADGTAMPMAH